jgi:hypothetical protein
MRIIAILEAAPIRLPIGFSLLSHIKMLWLKGILKNVSPVRQFLRMTAADDVAHQEGHIDRRLRVPRVLRAWEGSVTREGGVVQRSGVNLASARAGGMVWRRGKV